MPSVHLYRRGKTWCVYYFFEGRRVRRSLKTDNRKHADELRHELEVKLRNRQMRVSEPARCTHSAGVRTARSWLIPWLNR